MLNKSKFINQKVTSFHLKSRHHDNKTLSKTRFKNSNFLNKSNKKNAGNTRIQGK